MELMILDGSFENVGIIDVFESLIWTERYYESGDFELLSYPSEDNISILKQGTYATIIESEHIMVIEDVHIKTDPIDGNKLVVKGRSVESSLDRRIIWDPIKFVEEPIQYSIFTLLNEHALNPANAARKIQRLQFEFSTDPIVLSIIISNQYWGDYLYTAIVDLCYSNNIGFKITLNSENNLVFKLYSGLDKSYNQTENPYVIFSPDFENLKNSEYIMSSRLLKTAALTAGEKGVGNAQVSIEVDPSEGQLYDLNRREMFLDAQDVAVVNPNGEPISIEEYFSHLHQRGLEELSKNITIQTFASEVDPDGVFIFGRDFFLGDVLQVSNEYGYEGKARVVEVVHCQDSTGLKIYPIFVVVREGLNIDEAVTLGKSLTVGCPKDISESVVFNKNMEMFLGSHETIYLWQFLGLSGNGRF
jgi:hypothetical protein